MAQHIDPKGIKISLGLDTNGDVQKFLVNTCYKHMDKYVPKREGNLRTIVTFDNTGVTYEMPYARYQYYGEREDGTHQVHNYTTPGTGPYWDERMMSAEREKIIREVQRYIRRH
ncbi:MAG: capsid protein [Bacilli bacterium]|nr:capsid protein [Bacilli bacterium]MBO7526287.1 capsid protein [Clostridia bacterium]